MRKFLTCTYFLNFYPLLWFLRRRNTVKIRPSLHTHSFQPFQVPYTPSVDIVLGKPYHYLLNDIFINFGNIWTFLKKLHLRKSSIVVLWLEEPTSLEPSRAFKTIPTILICVYPCCKFNDILIHFQKFRTFWKEIPVEKNQNSSLVVRGTYELWAQYKSFWNHSSDAHLHAQILIANLMLSLSYRFIWLWVRG